MLARALVAAILLLGAAVQADAEPGRLLNCSGTVAATSAAITFTHRPQVYIEIHNPHDTNTLWINPVGGAAAANTAGSGSIPPGGYVWFDARIQPNSINIIAPAGATPYTCWYL